MPKDKQADQPAGQYLDPDEEGISEAERTARRDARTAAQQGGTSTGQQSS